MTNIVASAEMLINKPSNEVFDAFVEPRTIEKFWLKSASAPLAKNARVDWELTQMVRDKAALITTNNVGAR